MPEENLPTYLCQSADWQCVIHTASTPEEAAATAMQKQMDSEYDSFAVAAAIRVTPIQILTEQSVLLYSPSILADLGMHKYAAELIKQIQKDQKNGRKD